MRRLLVVLVAITVVSASALSWLGWKLLEQDRRERLESAADRIAAGVNGALAEAGERLSAWAASPETAEGPEAGLLLIFTAQGLTAHPPGRLLYRPYNSLEPEAPAQVFAAAEAAEFRDGSPERAIEMYRKLAESRVAVVRAGAWMRLARVLRKTGRAEQARAAAARLAELGGTLVAGTPAELVARHSLGESKALEQGLLAGRWRLTRGQFDFYLPRAIPPETKDLTEAAATAWAEWKQSPTPRGQRLAWVESRAYTLLWRAAAGRQATLILEPDAFLKKSGGGAWLTDSDGRIVAGRSTPGSRAVARSAGLWTIHVTDTDGRFPARGRLVMLGLAVMLTFLLAGSYFIARAIRREVAVARLQSDFVSAVSHEFRTPLTSIRQFSEMLLFDRTPEEARRRAYYEVLVKESRRLQRLVETLLNFGKMEAGARQYRFEHVDAGALIEQVVAEFAPAGRRIEVAGGRNGASIQADPEALSVALRNLIDNALKYSPDRPAVWVEWRRQGERLAIRVRDEGIGIPAAERKVIFEKFARGSAAAAANVRGTGVGLAMVRHIVAAHGGEIQLESEPGKGSTFTVLLPAGKVS